MFQVVLADVPAASAPAGGTLERVFQVLKADPIVGIAALALTALAVVATALWKAWRDRAKDAEARVDRLQAALDAEKEKRIELLGQVITLQAKTTAVLEEVAATLDSVDDLLPDVLAKVGRRGPRGSTPTGGTPVVGGAAPGRPP